MTEKFRLSGEFVCPITGDLVEEFEKAPMSPREDENGRVWIQVGYLPKGSPAPSWVWLPQDNLTPVRRGPLVLSEGRASYIPAPPGYDTKNLPLYIMGEQTAAWTLRLDGADVYRNRHELAALDGMSVRVVIEPVVKETCKESQEDYEKRNAWKKAVLRLVVAEAFGLGGTSIRWHDVSVACEDALCMDNIDQHAREDLPALEKKYPQLVRFRERLKELWSEVILARKKEG